MTEMVAFHGQVASDSLAQRLRGAAVGVVPYLDSPFMRVAYSTKAFEYAATGIPMIMSDLSSLREQFSSEAARFVAPGDVAAWADALRSAIAEPERSLEMAREAQVELGRFEWSDWKVRYVQTLTALVAGDLS